ncbi:unnamed protein product [Calypogeia fissa]
MPITPGHLWQESETWVSINVKIPNVTTSSADIITTECYVKVNSAPYIFEADLYGEVDCKLSKASVGFGAVNFFLVKKEHGLWERLSMAGEKNVRLQRRHQSLEAIRKERDKLRKEYPAKFSNLGRVAVGEQMKMDEVKRKTIENRKEAENLMEQEHIETWKDHLTKESQVNDGDKDLRPPPLQENSGMLTPYGAGLTSKQANKRMQFMPCEENNFDQGSSSMVGKSIPKNLGTFKNIKDCKANNSNLYDEDQSTINNSHVNNQDSIPDKSSQTTSSSAAGSYKSNVAGLRYTSLTLPAPRNCSSVSVSFSPKPDLPKHLPARESRDREIKLKKSGKASEDALDVSERAPLFLQDKGNKFFKSGDYQSAMNAYTDALVQDPSLVISLANRGACKLHLKDYKACVQDCTSALCILTKGTSDYAQETVLAQNSLVQETMLAQNLSTSSEAFDTSSTGCDVTSDDTCAQDPVKESPEIRFPVESLELLTCLSGQGCCSMQGLRIEGVGVEEWKLSMKKHMLVRRGFAQYQIGHLSKAINDYAKAVNIKPKNDEVERILKEMTLALAV